MPHKWASGGWGKKVHGGIPINNAGVMAKVLNEWTSLVSSPSKLTLHKLYL